MRASRRGEHPFERAAEHYDLLYREKDSAAEARFALAALRRLKPGARAVLDLGCGTGRHALELARLGCEVTGVDRSAAMLAQARRAAGGLAARERPTFRRGEASSLRLGRRFDAVVALFHVFGYLRGPRELARALARVRAHLRPGGALLFDCWHAPAVLRRPLRPRVKRVSDGARAVERFAAVRHDRANSAVEIRYLFRIRRGAKTPREFRETHLMRYWTPDEIDGLLRASGFEPRGASAWMSGRPLSASTWSACFTAVRG